MTMSHWKHKTEYSFLVYLCLSLLFSVNLQAQEEHAATPVVSDKATSIAPGEADEITIMIQESTDQFPTSGSGTYDFRIDAPQGYLFGLIASSSVSKSPGSGGDLGNFTISDYIKSNGHYLLISVEVGGYNNVNNDQITISNITLTPRTDTTCIFGDSIHIECSKGNFNFAGGYAGVHYTSNTAGECDSNRVAVAYKPNIGSYASLSLTDPDGNPVSGLLDYDTDYSAEISVWENYNCGFSDEDNDHDKSPTTPRNAVQCN